MWPRVMNLAVFSDPQVVVQLVPPRGRGRPTLYSPELIEEFCGLIVDGMTIDRACKEPGIPAKRTIIYWLDKYPEFKRKYDIAVSLRNQLWMDDCIDMIDDASDAAALHRATAGANFRWKQLTMWATVTARQQAQQPGDDAKPIGEENVQVVERDPVHGQLYEWELEYRRRQKARIKGTDRPSE